MTRKGRRGRTPGRGGAYDRGVAAAGVPAPFEHVPSSTVGVEEAADFLREVFLAESGRAFMTTDDLANLWSAPYVEPERDFAFVRVPSGALAAASIFLSRPPHVDPACFGAVDPRYVDAGLGSALTEWAERRAREGLAQAPPGARVALRVYADAQHDRSVRLLTDHGFAPERYFITMDIAFDGPPPAAGLPAGLVLREFTEDQLESGLRARNEAFRDHFGWVERPLDQQLAALRHSMGHPKFDPSLWWHLYEGDAIVANLWCSPAHEGDDSVGYVESLGVRKPWRGRGLGRSLLLHAFGEFHRRGKRGAALDVDADSLTGATRLYESVGMREVFRSAAYAKEVRPGEELAVTAL